MADEFPFLPYGPYGEPYGSSGPSSYGPSPSTLGASPFPSVEPIPPQPYHQPAASAPHPAAFQPQKLQEEHDELETRSRMHFAIGVFIAVAVFVMAAIFWLVASYDANDEPQLENLISAQDGGIVRSDGASIIIPPDALSHDTVVEINRTVTFTATDRYELKPHGLQLRKPSIVIIPYKESVLEEGQTPNDIVLSFWTDDNGTRRTLSYTVDSEEKTLSAELSEF